MYHLQVRKAGSGVNALLLLRQDFLLKQAGYRASSLKISTALCYSVPPETLLGVDFVLLLHLKA